ncbi:DUF6090 family protein [Winogradskyella maritima]|uniref:DUF6090 family protein n=1 Tax=Winogradskyella maritima TaxID=1517766 RepID=A0ABV8AGB7_9FLAO|nr:DUF6090 family protein [Winogradskyella maritima]
MENSKSARYFKYAIGEIILVVIGILIALQINNWNEKRKLSAERKQLITSIKEDLSADVLMLSNLLEETIKDQNTLKQQSDYISSVSFTMDSLVNFTNKASQFYNPFEGFNNNAYNSAKSSGNIEIINNKLKNNLFELSVLQEKVQSTLNKYSDIYVDHIMNLNERYPFILDFSFIKSGEIRELMWSDIDKKDLALRLNGWGTSKGNLYRLMTRELKAVLEKTKAVLMLIENETSHD